MRKSKYISCRRYLLVAGAAVILNLGGCASYQPSPLPGRTDLVSNIDQLTAKESGAIPTPAAGLGLTDVAILAVRNNPDLKAQRERLGVTRAQLFSAGLLPDPQVSGSFDHPTGNVPGAVNAFGVGVGYDMIPLLNRGARLESEKQAVLQSRLELMWQEWQVAQQARSLAVRLEGQRRQLALLRTMADLYKKRYRRSRKALDNGDITLDVAGTDLTALLDSFSQINQLEQTLNETNHELHTVLGLTPEAPLAIHLSPLSAETHPETYQRKMKGLEKRRPDLLALQAGYRSQEAKVRAAVLSQFPSITIGFNRARDTGSLDTVGFGISLNLPLFSRGKGRIAIERATRKQLREEYQARLDHAAEDVDKLLKSQNIVASQQRQLDAYLPTLKELVARGRRAYKRGDIDALTFLNMETTWIKKRQEKISLEQTQREDLIALQTLLALPENGVPRQIEKGDGGKK